LAYRGGRSALLLASWQALKALLGEVAIEGESDLDARPAGDLEADAVDKAELPPPSD
jgi:hypothetical protein